MMALSKMLVLSILISKGFVVLAALSEWPMTMLQFRIAIAKARLSVSTMSVEFARLPITMLQFRTAIA